MIIKSMARKTPSFGQLIRYFDKGQQHRGGGFFSRNLYADTKDREAVAREFEKNYAYLPKRVNGNALYHEIIVLDQRADVSAKKGDDILLDLATRYCQERAPDQLFFGRIHDDRDHRHIHLMISANAIKSPRRVRLTKSRFAEIQQSLENYLLERYPEAGATRIYTQSQEIERVKVTNREGQLEQRTGKASKKRHLRKVLQQQFAQATSQEELEQCLKAEKLCLYRRGKQIGIEPMGEGWRFRLKTLGLAKAYQQMQERFETEQERQESLLDARDVQAKSLSHETVPTTHDISEPSVKTQQAAKTKQEAELIRARGLQEGFAQEHLKDFEGDR